MIRVPDLTEVCFFIHSLNFLFIKLTLVIRDGQHVEATLKIQSLVHRWDVQNHQGTVHATTFHTSNHKIF